MVYSPGCNRHSQQPPEGENERSLSNFAGRPTGETLFSELMNMHRCLVILETVIAVVKS